MTGNLQAKVARFFGRDAELTRLTSSLRNGARLLTLCGPGGVGKTRLAGELLRRVEGEYAGGAWFCDASGATGADDLCRAVADVFGVELHARAASQLSGALAARGPMLLCLDNLEQIVAPAAAIVSQWLGACPELVVLVTSRSRLRIEGEQIVEVPPLADHGVALFVDRASQIGTALSDADRTLVQRIVDSLEHHPLAIELAAARTAVLSVAELAELLPERWDLLEHRRRDVPQRHHSVTATLWWSWDLLDRREQEVFARCALFAGRFDRHDAADVLGEDALTGLTSLQDTSLVQSSRDGDGVVMSMFVAMRDFGRARLSELAVANDAYFDHARWLMGRCKRAKRVEDIGELIDDAVMFHQWALTSGSSKALDVATEVLLALGPYFAARGPVDAQLARWDALLDRLEAPSARCLVECAVLHRLAGQLPEAMADLNAARRAGGSAEISFMVALESSRAHYAAGRLAESHQSAQEAERLSERLGDREAGLAATQLGRLVHGAGRPAEARDLHLAAIDKLSRPSDERDRCIALTALGFTLQDLGHSPRAEACFREAQAVYQRLGNRRAEARVIGYLGNVYRSRREREQAESCYAEALAVFRAQGDPWSETVYTMDHAILLSAMGDSEAQAVFERALTLARDTNNGRCAALIHSHLGALAADADQLSAAVAHFDSASQQLVELNDGQFPAVLATLRCHLELAHIRAGDADDDAEMKVRAHLAAPPAIESEHMRLARAIVERALERAVPPAGALRVARDGSWFSYPDRVDLDAHPALERMLLALASAPQPLDVEALFAAGWPGERALAAARKNRVRVAISTLRKRGLPVSFDRAAGGYTITATAVLI